jgi:hypothetical protein
MEKKPTTKKVALATGAVTPKKKKKKYYPPKKPKVAEKVVKEVVQPEPTNFVWQEEPKKPWLQRVVAWLTSIGK